MDNKDNQCRIDISDEDVIEAMKLISGYLDITPHDFREIYTIAYSHALTRLSKSVKAKDIMTHSVVTVLEESSLLTAAELMSANNISGLPVVNKSGVVVGIVSETDFLNLMGDNSSKSFMGVIVNCLNKKGCPGLSLENLKIKEIMSTPPVFVKEDTSLFETANLFEKKKINRAPVVNKDLSLTGIVTRSDIVQSYCIK